MRVRHGLPASPLIKARLVHSSEATLGRAFGCGAIRKNRGNALRI